MEEEIDLSTPEGRAAWEKARLGRFSDAQGPQPATRRVDGRSDLEEAMLTLIRQAGLPEPEREYPFHEGRRWRADFAYPDQRILIECEGGTWTGGRHTQGAGYARDCEKYNTAAINGWLVLRFTSDMVDSGMAVTQIQEALIGRQGWVNRKSGMSL